jgi:hypothetical protein
MQPQSRRVRAGQSPFATAETQVQMQVFEDLERKLTALRLEKDKVTCSVASLDLLLFGRCSWTQNM